MNYKIAYLSILLTFLSCKSQTQQEGIKVYYKKEIISALDSKKGEDLKKEKPKLFQKYYAVEKKRKEAAKRLNYYLLIADQTALFEVEDMLQNDKYTTMGLGPFDGTYYTNFNTHENLWQVDAFGREFLITLKKRKWKLTEEEKDILGYTCKKATVNQVMAGSQGKVVFPVEAWYAPDIPLNFGPLGYNGLPGLILEISVKGEHYYAKRIENNKKLNIEKPKKGKKIYFEELNEMAKRVMNSNKPN